MRIRQLKSVSEIVAVIGRPRLYELLPAPDKTKPQRLTNYIARGYLPSATYVAILTELAAKSCAAPDRLWRMIEHRRARAA